MEGSHLPSQHSGGGGKRIGCSIASSASWWDWGQPRVCETDPLSERLLFRSCISLTVNIVFFSPRVRWLQKWRSIERKVWPCMEVTWNSHPQEGMELSWMCLISHRQTVSQIESQSPSSQTRRFPFLSTVGLGEAGKLGKRLALVRGHIQGWFNSHIWGCDLKLSLCFPSPGTCLSLT